LHQCAYFAFDGSQVIRNVLIGRGHEQYSLV
jgi:hypothetical protein